MTSVFFSDSTTPDLTTFLFPSVTLNLGESFVLGVITYQIAGTATIGPVRLSVDPIATNGGASDLSDPSGRT